MSAVPVDVEEIQTTKSEKALAVVMAVFLLIGGIWTYQEIDDFVGERVAVEAVEPTASEQAAIARLQRAHARLAATEEARARTREDLELTREAYRTALDAGRPAQALEAAYLGAQADFRRADGELAAAEEAVAAAEPAAEAAQRRLAEDAAERHDRRALYTFLLRLGFVLTLVAAGSLLLARMRRRGSRWFPLAIAFTGFSAVLALVLAGDYLTDYVDPLELGPLVLAAFGVAVTILSFAALQRYLRRLVPARRVRRRECPFCGYPAAATPHCEGCGRAVVGACAHCGSPRRIGTHHCGACGAT